MVNHTPVPQPLFQNSIWGVPPLSEVEPGDIATVEVYRAWHEVPKDFAKDLVIRNRWERQTLNFINRKACGIVRIWTWDEW